MNKAHEIEDLSFSGTVLSMRVDGESYDIDLAPLSRRLAGASQEQLEAVEVSPSGYGLHWPAVDEDLSIDGLLGIHHQPPAKDKPSGVETDERPSADR